MQGIHHVTAIASDPKRNVAFFEDVLGLRLVKTTVNFDDPGTYHLYYGDQTGSPGTILTFFPWVGARPGRAGAGMTGATAFQVPTGSLDFWMGRLADRALDFQSPTERFGQAVLALQDPDGMPLELIETEGAANNGVVPPTGERFRSIPAEYAIRGFHGVTLLEDSPEISARVLTGVFGFSEAGQEGTRMRFRAAGDAAGAVVDLALPEAGAPLARPGAGTVHHVAFRAANDAEQLEWRERVSEAGLHVTPVLDRNYFHSIYFREPGGVLYEIATDPPGFTADEPVETLGSALKLPDWLEPRRAAIEARLPALRD